MNDTPHIVGTGERMNANTVVASFDVSPEVPDGLLQVQQGVPTWFALSRADCLDAAVRSLLQDSVAEPMDGDVAGLCAFAMEAAQALRVASGVTA